MQTVDGQPTYGMAGARKASPHKIAWCLRYGRTTPAGSMDMQLQNATNDSVGSFRQ
jgi:hypothetical protein